MAHDHPFTHVERAVEPELAIVDPHHHLWDDLTNPLATHYPLPRLLEDLRGGHHVVATVYAECTSHWRAHGPSELRPVGETEWIVGEPTPTGIMAGIIGYADLRLGAAVRPVLEAHRAAGGSRFSGVRHSTSWDPHADVPNTAREVPRHALSSPPFVRGLELLGEFGMTFDAWMYFHQLPDLVELARAVPGTTIVLDHLGGPLGIGPYALDRTGMLASWRENLRAVAELDNVVLKVGGLGFPYFLTDEVAASLRGSSDSIAAYWRPEVEFAIDLFGPDRCMLETDFPVDSRVADYVTLWNALKKATSRYTFSERQELFSGTAVRTYGLELSED